MNNAKLRLLVLCGVIAHSVVFAQSVTVSGTAILNNGSGTIWPTGTSAIWVVDTGDDGFSGAVTLSLSPGISLDIGSTFGDQNDLIANRVSVSGNSSLATVSGFGELSLSSPISTGQSYGVFVLDDVTSSDTTLPVTTYGFFRHGDGTDSWVLPGSGDSVTFSANPSGNNPLQLEGVTGSNLQVIPEPSSYATILGLLGLGYAVFCRRRRSSH